MSSDGRGEVTVSSASIIAYSIRSIIAAPLLVRDRLIGIVYLDNRVTAGIFDQSDVDFMMLLCTFVSSSFETARSALLELQKKEQDKDFEVTGAVQKLILPRQMDFETASWQLATRLEPANRSGGDWVWYGSLPDGRIRIILGDVTGHGAGAAMVSTLIVGAYQSFSAIMHDQYAGEVLLKHLDKILSTTTESNYWMTAAILDINSNGEVEYWLAGHPPFITLKNGNASLARSSPTQPIGSGIDFSVGPTGNITLAPGDKILLFSDGLVEIQIGQTRIFGERRLCALFSDLSKASTSVRDIADGIMKEAKKLNNGPSFKDDVSFFVLEYKQSP